jgi:hypothetical protein
VNAGFSPSTLEGSLREFYAPIPCRAVVDAIGRRFLTGREVSIPPITVREADATEKPMRNQQSRKCSYCTFELVGVRRKARMGYQILPAL